VHSLSAQAHKIEAAQMSSVTGALAGAAVGLL
jgi:hypothetical protein